MDCSPLPPPLGAGGVPKISRLSVEETREVQLQRVLENKLPSLEQVVRELIEPLAPELMQVWMLALSSRTNNTNCSARNCTQSTSSYWRKPWRSCLPKADRPWMRCSSWPRRPVSAGSRGHAPSSWPLPRTFTLFSLSCRAPSKSPHDEPGYPHLRLDAGAHDFRTHVRAVALRRTGLDYELRDST